MLRLTLLLCIGMYAALMTLGEDRGQMRPGLAMAVAEGRLGTGQNGYEIDPEPALVQVVEAPAVVEPAPVVDPVPEPLPIIAAAPEPQDPLPPVDIVTEREVVQVLEDPVFSLASLGNETVPGEDAAAEPAPEPQPLPVTGSGDGTIWYVTASSVNVRAAPSTEAEILDKLGTGEATLLLEQIDAEWARIVIQGDGLEGYVALRYLAPESP